MGAVGVLARFDIRRRWRSTIAIILLVGVVGAVVAATAAGARRSDTALTRFNAVSRSSDVELSVGETTPERLAAFRTTPAVEDLAALRAYAFATEGRLFDLAIAAPLDDAMGRVVDGSRLIAGRRAEPSAPDEMVIGEALSDQIDLRIGDHFEVPTFTAEQVERAFSGSGPEDPAGPNVRLRVVGIVRRPLDLGVRSTAGGVVVLTPAFHEKYDGRIGAFTDVLRVKTKRGTADVPQVVAAARQLFGDELTFGAQALGVETEGARNAIDVLTLALWIVAAVTAIAGFVAIGIVLTRDLGYTDLDQGTLSALGLTRRQRVALNGPRVLLIAGGGALLTALGAVALSPRFPFGVARRADPDPGIHADWAVLVIAILMIGVLVLGVALLATTRGTRVSASEHAKRTYRRTSPIVDRAAAAGLRPTATNGVRMAIQSGRGETAVPVRSAFVGAVFGVAGVTAALVFAASLSHLIATPPRYGWTWDAQSEVGTRNECADGRDHGVDRAPGVEAIALVCTTSVEIDGRPAPVWGFESLRGRLDPEVVAGRAPRGPGEIALGAVTLSELGKHIGDVVSARGFDSTHEYEIVGRIVLPTISDPQPLADGAAVTGAGFAKLYETGENETHFVVARLAAGATDADRAALVRTFRAIPRSENTPTAAIPVEIERLEQVDLIPVSIAGLLCLLAIVAVGHALVTAVRRRRSELALLKVLGFDRGQVRATVAWQASTLAAVGLVLGIPAGIVIGRLVWQLVADSLGVSTVMTVPTWWLVLLVPAALVLANLIAFVPGTSAARTRPAVALRST